MTALAVTLAKSAACYQRITAEPCARIIQIIVAKPVPSSTVQRTSGKGINCCHSWPDSWRSRLIQSCVPLPFVTLIDMLYIHHLKFNQNKFPVENSDLIRINYQENEPVQTYGSVNSIKFIINNKSNFIINL